MAMIDDIMQQLGNLGIDVQGGFSGLSSISPEQIHYFNQYQGTYCKVL